MPHDENGGLPLHVGEIELRYPGGVQALAGVSLDLPAGSFTALIGPNGSGKSTLLRLAAGLLVPTSGSVRVGDDAPRPGDGRIGLAFQQPRLVPWRTVADNVALPLETRGVPRAERDGRVAAALDQVGMADAADLLPAQLSGGLAQRAGLARALITDPGLLLLDEPFSALDLLTREAFDVELEALWRRRGTTVLLVTHSVTEAVLLADRVVVLRGHPGAVVAEVAVGSRPRPRAAAGLIDEAAVAEIRDALAGTAAGVGWAGAS